MNLNIKESARQMQKKAYTKQEEALVKSMNYTM